MIRTDTQRVRNTQTILPETHAAYPRGYVSDALVLRHQSGHPITEPANKILNPILKALKLDVKLPGIPGLNLLGRINFDHFDKMPDFAGMLDDLAGLFRNLNEPLKLFKVGCPPRKSAPTTSEVLASALKEARPKLVAA